MSKNKQAQATPAEETVVETVSEEVVAEETVVEETPVVEEPQVEEVTVEEPVVEEVKEETPVEPEAPADEVKEETKVEEVKPQPVEKEASDLNPQHEEAELAAKLGLNTKGVNMTTGRPIYPSTPMMRRMLEKQEQEARMNDKSRQDLIEEFMKKHNEHTLKLPQVQYVINTLADYTEKMSPENSIDELKGGEMQTKVAKLYDAVLGYEPELAMVCLEFIVAVVKANLHLAFNERYALRFINTLRVNQEQSYRFQMLTTLFIELAKGAKGDALNQVVNVRKLLDFVTDRNAKANLSEFLA